MRLLPPGTDAPVMDQVTARAVVVVPKSRLSLGLAAATIMAWCRRRAGNDAEKFGLQRRTRLDHEVVRLRVHHCRQVLRDKVEADALQLFCVILLRKSERGGDGIHGDGVTQAGFADAAEAEQLKAVRGCQQVLGQRYVQFGSLDVHR